MTVHESGIPVMQLVRRNISQLAYIVGVELKPGQKKEYEEI